MWPKSIIPRLPGQILFSLALLLAAVSGCGDDDSPEQNGDIVLTDVLIPLAVGNVWSGTYIQFDSTGTDSTTHTLTYEITDNISINGWRWYLEQQSLDDSLHLNLYKNLPTGLFKLERAIFQKDSAMLSFKYPAKRNDRYERFDRGLVVVATADTAIVVPRGQFSCIQYKTTLSQFIDDSGLVIGGGILNEFISPGAGYVKWEQFIIDDNDSAIMVGRFELDSLVLISKSPSISIPTAP